MFFPTVTEEEIAAVRALSYDDRQALIEEINNADPFTLFVPNDHAHGEVICPICHNGSGKSHTGVAPTPTSHGWLYGCRRPNCLFNGLLSTVIAKEAGLDKTVAEDFFQILAIGATRNSAVFPFSMTRWNMQSAAALPSNLQRLKKSRLKIIPAGTNMRGKICPPLSRSAAVRGEVSRCENCKRQARDLASMMTGGACSSRTIITTV